MTVSVITPTADRPVAFALAERWLGRQTRQPDEWIVADGGQEPVVCSMGQTHLHEPSMPGARNFLGNLARALTHASGDLIVALEDDDYYRPTHIEAICGQIHLGILAAGDDLQRYYHAARRCWRTFNNRGASLCQTAFTREAIPIFQAALERCWREQRYGVDAYFWASLPSSSQALQRTQTVIGMKGLPGQVGLGIGHRAHVDGQWRHDPDGAQLRAWIGEDARIYEALTRDLAGVPCH